MSNELSEEQLRDIFAWAIGASGVIHIMHHSPQPMSPADLIEKLNVFDNGIKKLIENMPDRLRVLGMDLAIETAQEVSREDEIVDEFMKDVDKYLS